MRVYLCIPERKGGVTLRELDLPVGATVADALEAAGFAPSSTCAIFCEKVDAQAPLKPEDRIDVAVPLALSPMEVRRLRAEQKERTAVPRPRHGGIHQLIKPLDESML